MRTLPILLLILASCQKVEYPFHSPGVLDLRAINENEIVTLDGPIRFYSGEFNGESQSSDKDYTYVQVPGAWNLYQTEQGAFGPTGFGTFAFKVLLPDDLRQLGIRLSDIGTAYRLYVDGHLIGQRGAPGKNPETHVPDVGQEVYLIRADSQAIEVRLEVSNFSYRKGGIWNPITIGSAQAITRKNWKDSSVQTLLVGILLIMGLYHCGFFLIRKQETSLFFFGLSCFLVALRELTLGPRLLPLLLPEISWVNYLRLEYSCFFLALPAFAFYIQSLFARYFWKQISYFFLGLSLLASLIVWVSPPLFFTKLVPYFQYVVLAFIIYGIVGLIRAATRQESGARTLLVSGIIMAITVINDAMLVRHFYSGPRVVALGQIQFVIAQAFMLALRFSRSMKRIEDYNRTIQQRNSNLMQQKSSLELRTIYDDLTGLGNRSLLMDTLEQNIRNLPETSFSLLLLNLDDFRKVNDSAGHVVGDTILVEISRRLKYQIPARDQLFRLEGDEFAIIHWHPGQLREALQFASRLRGLFASPMEIGESAFRTTFSIGVAHFPEHGQTPLMLFRSADSAVMQAKQAGKNREEEFDSERDMEHRIRLDLSERLEQAIRGQELSLHFQPIVDLKTGRTTGAEALLRWEEPELGFVAPDVFIPIAEETGQIRKLGKLVLQDSARALARWTRFQPDFCISVNISPGQLNHGELLEDLRSLISEHNIDPHNLKLEITENLLLEDKNISLLNSARALGVRLVMDDFGTGYSSFGYLQKGLFEILKIDKSFLLRFSENNAQPLIRAMVQMAHSLNMEVVAEGIETEEIAEFLRQLDCEMGQGYLYSN